MNIELLVVGKTDSKEVEALVELYVRRVNRYCRFAVTALPDVRNTRSLTQNQQRTAEGEAILRQLAAGDHVVLLDERGLLDLPFLALTVLLVIIGVIICALASAKVNSTYARYDQVRNHAGITGAMAAEQILRMEGIYDVQVMRVSGKLTDHYDPANHVLRLSDSTYGSTSVAALGVAAHECGHAIQHARHYVPLTIRGALVPVANFGSGISWPLIIMGLFIRGEMSTLFINLGILMFSLAVLFQIITLPVEFNASGRALKILKNSGMLYESEVREARSVLTAAALTYVASAASALLQLLRILILTGGRRNDDE